MHTVMAQDSLQVVQHLVSDSKALYDMRCTTCRKRGPLQFVSAEFSDTQLASQLASLHLWMETSHQLIDYPCLCTWVVQACTHAGGWPQQESH